MYRVGLRLGNVARRGYRHVTANPLLAILALLALGLLIWLLVKKSRKNGYHGADEDHESGDDVWEDWVRKEDKRRKNCKRRTKKNHCWTWDGEACVFDFICNTQRLTESKQKKREEKERMREEDDSWDEDFDAYGDEKYKKKHWKYRKSIPSKTGGDNPQLEYSGAPGCKYHTRSQKWNNQWECSDGKWGNPAVKYETGVTETAGILFPYQCAYTKACADKMGELLRQNGSGMMTDGKAVTLFDDTSADPTRDANAKKDYKDLNKIIELGDMADRASEIYVPAGYKVTLYRDPGGSGQKQEITGEKTEVLWGGSMNDAASSMKIEKL